ncbi:hypothetical protein MAM1_0093c04972 [Mucor ambiguus]|uniref:C2H2-type domain-containing protein n=1 Tax=Mucor ambiguus TaxID=91626 RepID=A0A0C9M6L0_9FUNG|nr:hypothetical protein MAM1_0093c04972 [Mucor ambiguus]
MSNLSASATQQLVVIVNKCFVCDKPFSTPQRLRSHLKQQHNIILPERPTGIRRYNTPHFVHPQAIPLQLWQKDDNDQLTQENSDSEERESPSSERPFEDNTESLVSVCPSFSPPDDNDHLLIDAFDATDAFYKLQQSLQTQKWKLSLEDHIFLPNHHGQSLANLNCR